MDYRIRELAKQGDPKAIADVFNYFLQSQGITTKASLKNNLLEIVVEAYGIPDREESVRVIRKTMGYLKVAFIKQVKIYAKQTGTTNLAWYQEFELDSISLPSDNINTKNSSYTESTDFSAETSGAGKNNLSSDKKVSTLEYCRDKARKELTLMMGGSAVVGAVPVPGAFTAGTTAVQIAVVTRLAKIYDFSLEAAGGAAAVAGAIMVFGGASTISKIAGEAATFIPVVGWIAKPAIAAATTKAFGEAAIAYFESHYPDKICHSNEDK